MSTLYSGEFTVGMLGHEINLIYEACNVHHPQRRVVF